MDKFIYVFDTAARDNLIAAGFLLLKQDERNGMWVFSLDNSIVFDLHSAEFSYITSNTLTF